MSSKLVFPGVVALSLSFGSPARAGDLPEAHDESIDVVGARLPAPADPTASETVVDPSRYQGEAKDVAALVSTAPGVAVLNYGGLGQLATIQIRGSTADDVLILLDGLPLNTAAGGAVDLSTIPASWIGRLDVARGAEGARYGAGALGGAVDVITRRPEPGTWAAEATSGSFGTLNGSASGAFELGRSVSVLAAAEVDSTRGDYPYLFGAGGAPQVEVTRANDAALHGGGILKLAANLGDSRLDVLAQLSGGRRGLPGNEYAVTPTDWQEDGRALLAARLESPGPLPGVTLSTRAHLRLDLLDTFVDPLLYRQRGGATGLDEEVSWAHPGGLLTVGASIDDELLVLLGDGPTRQLTSGAASLADDLDLLGGRLRLSPALRAEQQGPFGGLSAKLGARLRLVGGLSVRASAGSTFRPPSLTELYLQQGIAAPNPDLRPERAESIDAALVYEGPGGHASAGPYATRYHDLIVYEPTSASGRLEPFNTGESIAAGAEAELATVPLPALLGLSGAASYTYLFTEDLHDVAGVVGNWLPERPRHRLFARASLEPGPVAAHVELHWVSRQFLDLRNVDPIPAAVVWNAGASARVWRDPELWVHLEVLNVLDVRTQLDPLGNPLPGRTVMVTLRAGSRTEGRP